MFDRIRQAFNPVDARVITLNFAMDLDSSGQHVVHIYKKEPDGNIKNVDIAKLWTYGYHEENIENNHLVIYTISENDQHTLAALKSLNPKIRKDGALLFEIEPPVLSYLRKKNIPETKESKTIQIINKSIPPTAQVSFDPKSGFNVVTGYSLNGDDKLTPARDLKRTKDGQYARLGNFFVRLGDVSEKARPLLDRGTIQILSKDIPEFFQRDLVMIKSEFNAVLTDLVEKVHVIVDPLKPVVRVRKDPRGWLDFDIQYHAQGFVLPHNLLVKARKEGQEYFQVDETNWIKIHKEVIIKTEQQLKELHATLAENGFRIPASEFASLEEFISGIGGQPALDEAYKTFLKQLTDFKADSKYQLTLTFEAHLTSSGLTLRPYQRAGIHWLNWLRSNSLHGVLADDMGLGKTIESLSVLRLGYEETKVKHHSMVIAPKSVLIHWEREIQRVFPTARTYIFHGQGRNSRFFKSSLPYIFITTYDTVVRDIEALSKIPFYYLILDEATRIKNPDTRRSQSIKSLNALHRLALSGTPVENRPAELWSLFDFLMRGHLGKFGTFQNTFENSILDGNTETATRLGRRIKPFILRRKKEDVAKDLPEKIVMTEWVSLTEEQRTLYGELINQFSHVRTALQQGAKVSYTANILPLLTKLKQICDHPALVTGEVEPISGRSEKFDFIIEMIDEILANKEYVVIFSHFLQMLSLFEGVLKEKGISYIRIDGSTNHRQVLIDRFNQRQCQVALLSIMATGHGINMTAANHVIHADRWWNPAVEDQATDRVHRIGQDKTVYVYHILAEGTLEERIDRLLSSKREIASQIIGAATQGERRWSREELLELLKPLN